MVKKILKKSEMKEKAARLVFYKNLQLMITVALIPSLILSNYLRKSLEMTVNIPVIVLLTFFALSLFISLLANWFKCPRCGKIFYAQNIAGPLYFRGGLFGLLGNKCVNCGFELNGRKKKNA